MSANTVDKAIVIASLRVASPLLRSYFWISLTVLSFGVGQTSCSKPPEPAASDAATPSAPTASSTPGAVVDTSIQFNAAGNSERYRVSGWSQTENEYTWSAGKFAQLGLPIPSDPGALALVVKMGALVSLPAVPYQKVEVFANGQEIVDWEVADTADFTALIPAKVTKKGSTLNIEFRVPNATSPKALGLGDDARILGVRIYSVELKHP
jgi:hypothetical protein